jgi:uncharacterized Fe-S cluster protein YjdI
MIRKKYTRDQLTVVWQPHLCIHSAICFRHLPQVFRPRERPWVQLEHGEMQTIKDTVQACPSGALSLELPPAEAAKTDILIDSWHEVRVLKNGPLRIKHPCQVMLADGTIVSKPHGVTLCRCGGSSDKPFCDGSHRVNGFKD